MKTMNNHAHNATLDGLRGVAALSVVFLHLTTAAGIHPFPERGYLAVDFFFMLSGLVIAAAYERKLRSTMSLQVFAKIRMIRLYPLIFLSLFLGFVVKEASVFRYGLSYAGVSDYREYFEFLIFGLLLLPCPVVPNAIFPLNGPMWSLMFEVWINLFYAASIRMLSNRFVFAIIICAAIGLTSASYLRGSLDAGFGMNTLWIGSARVTFSFFGGVLIHRFSTRIRLESAPKIPASLLALALFLTLTPAPPALGWFYDVAIVTAVYPIIVAFGQYCEISATLAPLALLAGRLSYPLYILHRAIFGNFFYLRHRQGGDLWGAMLLLGGLMIIVSYFAVRFYDEPLRKFISLRRRRERVEALSCRDAMNAVHARSLSRVEAIGTVERPTRLVIRNRRNQIGTFPPSEAPEVVTQEAYEPGGFDGSSSAGR